MIYRPSNIADRYEDEPVRSAPIDQHHPTKMRETPVTTTIERVCVPLLRPPSVRAETSLHEWVYETTEWSSLVGLCSPRVEEGDTPDSYLSRYALPESTTLLGTTIRRIRWSGLINTEFIIRLVIEFM